MLAGRLDRDGAAPRDQRPLRIHRHRLDARLQVQIHRYSPSPRDRLIAWRLYAWIGHGVRAASLHAGASRFDHNGTVRLGSALPDKISPAFLKEGGMRWISLQLGGDDRIRTGDKGFADPRLN